MGALVEDVLSGLAVAGSAGSGVFAARGARAQGRAVETAAGYNAQNILRESNLEAARIQRSGRQEIGRQRAVLGASGLAAEGSPLMLIAANAAEVERQAMERRLAGQFGANVELARGRTARKETKQAATAELLGGGVRAAYFGHKLFRA